jgi:hypothetical protein
MHSIIYLDVAVQSTNVTYYNDWGSYFPADRCYVFISYISSRR